MSGYMDPFAPKRKVDYSEEVNASTHSETGVPKGSIKEIMAWVGEDSEKAKLALDVENKDPEPRETLIKKLNGLVVEPAPIAEPEVQETTKEEVAEVEEAVDAATPDPIQNVEESEEDSVKDSVKDEDGK